MLLKYNSFKSVQSKSSENCEKYREREKKCAWHTKTADLNEWICVQTVYNGGMSVQTGNESEKRVHLTRWEKDGRIKWAKKKKKKEKKPSERNYEVNMEQPQGKPKNILIFHFNDQTLKPADTFKPPQHSFGCWFFLDVLHVVNRKHIIHDELRFVFSGVFFVLCSHLYSNVNHRVNRRKMFLSPRKPSSTDAKIYQLLCNMLFLSLSFRSFQGKT